MSKKILAIYFSQTGQLGEIVENFTTPFVEANFSVEKIQIQTKNKFNFPWTSKRFFDAMPESVLGIPTELESFTLKEKSYDLIIFAYQPWYLSPSIPANSILHHPILKNILKNTPVITLIGARNMWLNAQEKVKKFLKESEAKLVGNIVLTDKNSNLVSAVTILYWMMSGKKDRWLGIFPKPGITDEDISHAKKFGEIVNEYLQKNNWNGLQEKLVEAKAVEVKPNLMFIEARAGRLFSIWANFIIKRKNRTLWLSVFKYYLVFALFIVAPIVLTVNNLIFTPFLKKTISKKKQYYSGIN